jgi:hypothetical protein
MRNTIKFRFAGIGLLLVTVAAFSVAVMLLWNALMPQIFAFPQIGYLQAAGLLVLARILFGGIGGSHARRIGALGAMEDGRLFGRGNKLREKWMNMSADERKEFVEKEKDFFRFHRDFLQKENDNE